MTEKEKLNLKAKKLKVEIGRMRGEVARNEFYSHAYANANEIRSQRQKLKKKKFSMDRE